MCDFCSDGWRFEATHLHTGVVKAVLHPISSEWDDNYSRTGSGQVMVETFDPSASDVWPHTTGLYISQVATDGTRVGRFGGFVQAMSATGAGDTLIGVESIDTYPFHRLLANEDEGIAYSTPGYVSPEDPGPGQGQNVIAKELLQIALTGAGSIPLIPQAAASTQSRVRSWLASDFKNIGEAIRELINTANGVTYRLEHEFFENPGRWQTVIRFTDETNTVTGVKIRSNIEAWRYGLLIDAKDQASRIYGVGSGTGASTMFSVAYDADAPLPEFQATVAFKDISVPETLDAQTRGEVTIRRDPATTPTATLVGLTDVPPEDLLVGDIIEADIGYGLYTFRDEQAKVEGQKWRLAPESPVTRELFLQPLIRPSLSVKTQTPAVAPPPPTPEQEATPPPETPIAPPPPQAGLVTTVKVAALNEISGMQYQDGAVWLTNDENNNPQIRLVSLTTGTEIGAVNPAGPNRVDPEALRAHPDGRLFLGDIGDNDNNRATKRLFAVRDGATQTFDIRYPFGARNAECLLIHPTSGEVFVVTKEGVGRAVSFGAGPTAGTGTQVAGGLPANISDGTFTNNGRFILFTVVGASVVYVYSYPGWQAVGQIGVPSLPKMEAITIESDCSFLVTTEGKNAPIHRVLIPTQFGGCI